MDQDWDLRAVVRGGHTNNMEPAMSDGYNCMIMGTPTSCFVPRSNVQEENDSLFHNCPLGGLFETTTAFDELEELYKPFYPVWQHSPLSSPTTIPSSSCVSLPQQAENVPAQKMNSLKEPPTKYKKRKNQQKRVVKEVKEDGLCADMWAWRKYGQKPIKGSPYPRSYYRCSSSKGCSARKQVERSPSKPEIFIITYTAEHSHAHPTRRNSLAGSTRSKFPAATKASKEDELVQKEIIKRDYSEEVLEGESSSEIIAMPNDDHLSTPWGNHDQIFPSLEDFERGLEELDDQTVKKELLFDHQGGFLDGNFGDDHFFDHANWFIDNFSATVGGAC